MRRPAPPLPYPPPVQAIRMAVSHADNIRAAIQTMLDTLGDGWQVAQHVIAMSLERVSTGLLDAAVELDVDANHDTDTP